MFSEKMNKTIKETFNRKSVKGDFGVEIETEGDNLFAGGITQDFTAHEDGSLRRGMEYVSNPLPLKNVYLAVENLRNILNRNHCVLKPTYRASTHIHHNFIENTWSDVLGAVVGWTIVEPVILDAMPPGRNGSLFCMASFDTGDATRAVDHLCSDITSGVVRGRWNFRGKYASQNLLRLADLGTIEYRVFPSSMDGHEIEKWCTWVDNIRTQAVEAKDRSFLNMVEFAEKNPFEYCGRVFNGAPPVPEDRLPGLIDFGARHAYELARVVNEHIHKPKKEGKKKKGVYLGEMGLMMAHAREEDGRLIDEIVEQAIPEPFPVAPVPELDRAVARRRLERLVEKYGRMVEQEEAQVRANHPGAGQRLRRRRRLLEQYQEELRVLNAAGDGAQ